MIFDFHGHRSSEFFFQTESYRSADNERWKDYKFYGINFKCKICNGDACLLDRVANKRVCGQWSIEDLINSRHARIKKRNVHGVGSVLRVFDFARGM